MIGNVRAQRDRDGVCPERRTGVSEMDRDERKRGREPMQSFDRFRF